jgi:hypothetical protein
MRGKQRLVMVGDPSPRGQGAARDRQAVPGQTGDDERAFDRIQALGLGSTVERGFWTVDGMMVQVSGFRLAANRESD